MLIYAYQLLVVMSTPASVSNSIPASVNSASGPGPFSSSTNVTPSSLSTKPPLDPANSRSNPLSPPPPDNPSAPLHIPVAPPQSPLTKLHSPPPTLKPM